MLAEEASRSRESDTVLRVLDRNADIETRYGGGFVQSIDGLAGGTSGGRRSDWFFYVNGIESPIGVRRVRPLGRRPDLVGLPRLDRRDAGPGGRRLLAGAVPARLSRGERWPAERRLPGGAAPATWSKRARRAPGSTARTRGDGPDRDAIRVLVGPWDGSRDDSRRRAARRRPDRSGVFARFAGDPSAGCSTLLDQRGRVAGRSATGAGLVAALRPGDGPADLGGHRHRRGGRRGRSRGSLAARHCANRYARRDRSGGRGPIGGAGADEARARLHARPQPASPRLARRRDRLPRRARRSSPSSTRARWSCSAAAAAVVLAGLAAGAGRAVRAALRLALPLLL